jgi:beta-mannosidase
LAELRDGWEVAGCAPDAVVRPSERFRELEWIPARVPGTAAGALLDAGRWSVGEPLDVDGVDWWFRTRFSAAPPGPGEEVVLVFDGIATVAEVFLDGELVLESDSMFRCREVDVGARLSDSGSGSGSGEHELAIRCRALAPLLRPRRRPRARWRTRLVSEPNLRFFRTMLIGRAPGFAPGPAVVGPWRPVRLERRRGAAVSGLRLRPRVEGKDGVLDIGLRLRGPAPEQVTVELSGGHGAQLSVADDEARGSLTVPDVELWWPHTHGRPALYDVALGMGEEAPVRIGRVGFRSLAFASDLERDGLRVAVGGVDVFARGALWTPLFGGVRSASVAELRRVLEAAVAAGMNMLRVPGIGCYETPAFYDLLDELGILLWQDFMFANLDYPETDEAFMAAVREEASQVLAALAGRPSLAVLCGGSEVAQQVAMMGLDPALASGPLFGELLPELVHSAGVDAAWVPSAPWGGDLPFRPDRGVANYYGVGGYRRGLEDVRRAAVKFAAECLAFANVPDEEALAALEVPGGLVVHHPRWKAGVPRDAGTGWDFDDVRDHYLRELFGVEPVGLRGIDHDRYLELSRAVTGEIMAEVLGEWRRAASPCAGGLVLWLTDLAPGAGWGLLDHSGEPKVAYHHLRRALAPVAVWSTDEGLGGVAVHVANDGPSPLRVRVRVALYRDLEVKVGEAFEPLSLEAHSTWTGNVEAIIGHFVDVSWAYRFGPPAQDLIVLSLLSDGDELISQSFRLPAGRPTQREPAARIGLSALSTPIAPDRVRLTLRTTRFAYGVRVQLPGFALPDDAFSLEPGAERVLTASRLASDAEPDRAVRGRVTALNLAGHVPIAPSEPA